MFVYFEIERGRVKHCSTASVSLSTMVVETWNCELTLETTRKKKKKMRWSVIFCVFVCVWIALIEYGGVRVMTEAEWFKPFNVTYDHRALILDGKRRILISAGIHYPRATPEVSTLSPNLYHVSSVVIEASSRN